MAPIRKIRISDQVISAIRKMIHEDGFKPGDKFYSENELTEKLGVSRSSIREAMRILEARGHVTVRHGKGIYISETNEAEFEAFTGWLKSHEQTILDHFDVRLIIDPKAAAYAAKNADEDDIRAMEEVCEEFASMAPGRNTADLIKCDEDFHQLLAKSTKNRTLFYLMKAMAKSLPEGWISSLHTPGRIEKTVLEHRLILEAIRERNAVKAEEAMIGHLQKAIADIKTSMNG